MQAIILAAGQGTRMASELPKVLVPLKGKPMIEHLIQSLVKSKIKHKPIIIVSPDNKEIISKALEEYDCDYVPQEKQLGTGNALACAQNFISTEVENIVCFYGDHPFITTNTINNLLDHHRGIITMMTAKVKDFQDWRKNFYYWGRIIRNGDSVQSIVEFRDADENTKKIKEVNPALYSFNSKWLWDNINFLKNNNAQKEYYLTDLISLASTQNHKINTLSVDPREAMGINSKEELNIAENFFDF